MPSQSSLDVNFAKEHFGLKEVGWKKGESIAKFSMGPVLLTRDIGPCIAASFYCCVSRTVALMHTHPESTNTTEKLNDIHDLFQEDIDFEPVGSKSDLVCWMRGGLGSSESSRAQAKEIRDFCRARNIPVIEQGLLDSYMPGNNEAVLGVSTDGTVYTSICDEPIAAG